MKRNLKFIWLLVKFKLSHMMVFRVSFFGAFFADGTLFLVQLLSFGLIYGHVDRIGSWTRGQMLIFVGTFSLINALNMVIFFFGIVDLPDKIRRGDLDQYLTKPISPLLRLTFENVNPGSLPLIALSLLIVCWGVSETKVTVSLPLALGYAALVALMTLLWYDMELILRTVTFLVLTTNDMSALEGVLIELNFQVPGVLFRGFIKILFYFILPYGIMSTVPTQLLTRSISPAGLCSAAATAVVFTAIALGFWKFGLRHYRSASS